MSFILDALRKSEHQRQKTAGPGLAEVPVAAARPKPNLWATAAVALLVVNLLAVGVLLVHRAGKDGETPAAVPATTASAATVSATTASAATVPVTPAPIPAPASRATVAAPVNPTLSTPPPISEASRTAALNSGHNPLAEEVGDTMGPDPSLAAAAAAVPAGPPAVTARAPVKRGSVVYETVPEASDLPYSPPAAAPAAAPSAERLPTADDMLAQGVPALHLDLHVFANQPQQRFIFVNSRKYREGETLQEGPVVEKITQDGAVLNFRGNRFKLAHD